jgi:hypothetical protein
MRIGSGSRDQHLLVGQDPAAMEEGGAQRRTVGGRVLEALLLAWGVVPLPRSRERRSRARCCWAWKAVQLFIMCCFLVAFIGAGFGYDAAGVLSFQVSFGKLSDALAGISYICIWTFCGQLLSCPGVVREVRGAGLNRVAGAALLLMAFTFSIDVYYLITANPGGWGTNSINGENGTTNTTSLGRAAEMAFSMSNLYVKIATWCDYEDEPTPRVLCTMFSYVYDSTNTCTVLMRFRSSLLSSPLSTGTLALWHGLLGSPSPGSVARWPTIR